MSLYFQSTQSSMSLITLGEKKKNKHWENLLFEKKKKFCMSCSKWDVFCMFSCTSPMYLLSTRNHNLYTFAQSAQCLYIHSYFISHMIFFLYMCMCQIFFVRENNEIIDMYDQTNWIVFFWVCGCMSSEFVTRHCERKYISVKKTD